MELPDPLAGMSPGQEWTEPERWVWGKVCLGEVANFNEKFDPLQPSEPSGWGDDRLLGSSFLETILMAAPYQGPLSRRGVRIIGAWIKDPIDYSNGKIFVECWIDASRFEQTVDLRRAQLTDLLSFDKSFFAKGLNLSLLHSKNIVNLRNMVVSGSINLSGASIERDLALTGTSVTERILMDGMNAARDVLLDDNTVFGELQMICAEIGGQLHLTKSRSAGILNLNGLTVRLDLFMSESVSRNINLSFAVINGQLDMEKVSCSGKVDIGGLIVKQDLFMGAAEFKELSAISCEIIGQFDLEGLKVTESVDMNDLAVTQDMYMHNGDFGSATMKTSKIKGQLNMEGAKARGEMNLNGLSVGLDLFMNKVAFVETKMIGCQIGGQLHICASKITGVLNLAELTLGNNLFLEEGSEFHEINLTGAQIGGTLRIFNIRIERMLDLSSAVIKRNLKIGEDTLLAGVSMEYTQIGGFLDLHKITVNEKLSLTNLSVGGSLKIQGRSAVADTEMFNARVGKTLEIDDVRILGNLRIRSTFFAQGVSIRNSAFNGKLELKSSSVQGDLVWACSDLSYLDLSGTTIQGELIFEQLEGKNKWIGDSFLNLRNTKVGALAVGGDWSWPGRMEFDGFTFGELGDIATRDVDDFVVWLSNDKTYSSQPYVSLAQILNKAGYSEKANRILLESKNIERRKAWDQGLLLKWLGLSLLNWTIGYGYGARYFRSLIWVLGLTIIGVLVVGTVHTGQMRSAALMDRIGFSLDLLLPVIEFNDKYKIDFGGWQETYFYFHKVMGFVLSSFVVAGLSGITKK